MSERPIRICFVTTHSFTIATLCKGLFPYLRAHGYEVEVVVGDDEYNEFDPRYFGKLEPHIIPMQRTPHPLRDPVALLRFMRYFRRENFDIVHVSTPKATLLGSIGAKLSSRAKVVQVYRRCVYEMMTGLKRRFYQQNDRITGKFSDAILPISRQIRDFLVTDKLVSPKKIRMIGSGSSNGIDVRRFSPDAVDEQVLETLRRELSIPEGAPVLVYVGRVAGEKGVDLLPAVLEEVHKEHPDAILVVAGPDDARDPPSEATSTRFANDPAIRRLGYTADPSPLYALATLFVFPSYFEGFGNVLLEAAAQERVAIGFDVPGVQEAIADGESGILVPKGDTAAMGTAANHLLSNPDERDAMARRARARVVNSFSNEVVWAELDACFRALIGRPAERAQ